MDTYINLFQSLFHPLLALVIGIMILVAPGMLRLLVAIYLIVIGVTGLFQ